MTERMEFYVNCTFNGAVWEFSSIVNVRSVGFVFSVICAGKVASLSDFCSAGFELAYSTQSGIMASYLSSIKP